MRLLIAFAVAIAPYALFLLVLTVAHQRRKRDLKHPSTSFLLHPPGESLRLRLEQLDEALTDQVLSLVGVCAFIGLGAWAWQDSPALSGLMILIGLVTFAIFSGKLLAAQKLRRDCYLGFLGERALGEELNQLLANGWSVFHDAEFSDNPGTKSFNVDHVVVGTGGLFAIETKTRRKKIKHSKSDPKNEVIFNGATLSFPWGEENFGVREARERA